MPGLGVAISLSIRRYAEFAMTAAWKMATAWIWHRPCTVNVRVTASTGASAPACLHGGCPDVVARHAGEDLCKRTFDQGVLTALLHENLE